MISVWPDGRDWPMNRTSMFNNELYDSSLARPVKPRVCVGRSGGLAWLLEGRGGSSVSLCHLHPVTTNAASQNI